MFVRHDRVMRQGVRAQIPQEYLARNKRRSERSSRCAARAALDLTGAKKVSACRIGVSSAADAGTQVLCMLNSLGSIDPPNWIRVLWCVLEGAIAASLVIAGALRSNKQVFSAAVTPKTLASELTS